MLKILKFIYLFSKKKKKNKQIYSIIKNFYMCSLKKGNIHYLINSNTILNYLIFNRVYKNVIISAFHNKWFFIV